MLLAYISKRLVFQLIAVFFGSWYMISMFVLIRNVKERPASAVASKAIPQPFVTSILRSMRNSGFRPLVVGWICDFASLSFLLTLLPFYIKYYIEAEDSDSLIGYSLAALFVSGFCSIPVWFYISQEDRKGDEWYEKLSCYFSCFKCFVSRYSSLGICIFL